MNWRKPSPNAVDAIALVAFGLVALALTILLVWRTVR